MSLGLKPQDTMCLTLNWGISLAQISFDWRNVGYGILQLTFVDRGGNETKTLSFPLKFYGGGPIKALPADLENALNQRLGTVDAEFVGE